MTPESIIETDNLSRRYHRQLAVDTLSFTVKEGEIFGFLGPNGAGKTTTLLMLLGLSRPSGGSAKVCGLDPLRNSREVKRLVGYLPENVGFYGELDAVQSLEYVANLNGIEKVQACGKIDELLELVGLKKDARKKVGDYSRGMKQRLGIAEVLMQSKPNTSPIRGPKKATNWIMEKSAPVALNSIRKGNRVLARASRFSLKWTPAM